MSIHRSYFLKSNTLIKNNLTNNSQNPVTEIAYGGSNKISTHFIFDVNLTDIKRYIVDNNITSDRIVSHKLVLYNTIDNQERFLGKKSYDQSILRASSFDLETFVLDEEWSEGSGYDFVYNQINYPFSITGTSNWFYKDTNVFWNDFGAYSSGTTTTLGSLNFEKGSENFIQDITSYINSVIYSGSTDSVGLGIKFTDSFLDKLTPLINAVAFHTQHTPTFFKPYIETIIDDLIEDDRNTFYLDRENKLYCYLTNGLNVSSVDSVDIIDNNGQTILTILPPDIERVRGNIYSINVQIDSDLYPDQIIFYDRWNITVNGKQKEIIQDFLLQELPLIQTNKKFNPKNYYLSLQGIYDRETISSQEKRNVKINLQTLYSQLETTTLDIEYRVYIKQTSEYNIDVIPWTKVDRTSFGYEFDIDFSWMLPQTYYIDLRYGINSQYILAETKSFKIVDQF